MSDKSGSNDSAGSSAHFDPRTDCTEPRKAYEQCFRKWYSEQFLKGNVEMGCQDQWDDYEKCVNLVLQEKKLAYLKPSAKEEKGKSKK